MSSYESQHSSAGGIILTNIWPIQTKKYPNKRELLLAYVTTPADQHQQVFHCRRVPYPDHLIARRNG